MTQRIGASRMKNRPCILRISHIMPSWLLGCGVFVSLALIPIHVWAQPVIRSIVPAQPAPGQVVTIQGHSLVSTTLPSVTVQIPGTQPSSHDAEVLPSPSDSNEVYVRLPPELPQSDGDATLNLAVNGTIATWSFQIEVTPAAPIPRMICDTALLRLGCPEITSAVRGQPIGIQAFGTDISGVTAVFSQGINERPAVSEQTFSNSVIGIVNEFAVPEDLVPGLALVQFQVSVGGIPSDLSFAVQLMIQ